MKEDFLHYVWRYGKFDTIRAFTTSGEKITVVHPGDYLRQAGPDFFNAQISIGLQRWAGNIEIHLKSSDWYLHRHETDPAYENVILHVVWEHDVAIFRRDNSEIPVLELKELVDPADVEQYYGLLSDRNWIHCEKQLGAIDPLTRTQWLDRVFLERLEQKSEPIRQLYSDLKLDWEAVLFVLLAKGFGLNTNGEVFRDMAMSIPFHIIRKEAREVENLEALLFSRAGFLEADVEDAYHQELRGRRDYLFSKYNLTPTAIGRPEFFKHRPDNFPTIRLAQLAWLYHSTANLFSQLISCDSHELLAGLFRTGVSEYWQSHYLFGKSHPPRKKLLSSSFINLLIINTIVPLQFAYSRYLGLDASVKLIDMLSSMPAERNSITDKFDNIGFPSENAFDSQALLQMKRSYCEKSRCLECLIGLKLLQRMDSS